MIGAQISSLVSLALSSFTLMLSVLPSSGTYKLNNYGFGNGGTANTTSSATYGLNAIAGEQSRLQVTGATSNLQTGNNYEQNAQVPTVALTNSTNYYNKLLVTISPLTNATDALYAVAISTDSFATTNYIKSDGTIGGTLTYPGDYRTYAGWGSGSGVFVIGLSSNTSYSVKAKAIQGKYSETAYGPVSTVSTVAPQFSFSLRTGAQASPPFSIGFGTLSAGSVASALDQAQITFATNAEAGGYVYISGQNGGLTSANSGGTISSVNGDLSSLGSGYGVQGSGATQSSGGPFTIVGPNYNGSSNNVGAIDSSLRQIFTTSGPVVGGAANVLLKAKTTTTTPPAIDYTDVMTLVAAGGF